MLPRELFTFPQNTTCTEQIEQMCEVMQQGELFWQLTNKYDEDAFFIWLVIFSCLINTIFFFLMWRIKELQQHPMQLFMLITGCDASVLYIFPVSTKMCEFGLHKLFMWTTEFVDTCESERNSLIM